MAPAQKKSVILPMACITMCNEPPMAPAALAMAAPRTMYESWEMVEYASRALRLSLVRATQEVNKMVTAATAMSQSLAPVSAKRSIPKI